MTSLAASCEALQQRIANLTQELPGYPADMTRVSRMLTYIDTSITRIYNHALKAYDLNYVTYSALMMLYSARDAGMTPSALSDATGEKPANITRICDELTARDLLRRHASSEDRRSIVMTLSPKGRKLALKVASEMALLVERMFTGMPAAQIAEMERLLLAKVAALTRLEEELGAS